MGINFLCHWALVLVGCMLGACVIVEQPIHMRRGLGTWEKYSHLIDSVMNTVNFTLGYLLVRMHIGSKNVYMYTAYVGLVLLSVLLTLKDEHIHRIECPASEQFLHAFMFSLNGMLAVLSVLNVYLLQAEMCFLAFAIISSMLTVWMFVSNHFVKPPEQNLSH